MKYHVPTGFCFSPKASGFYPFGDATTLTGEGGVRVVVWLIQAWIEIRHAAALTTGAKRWHRQKAVFYVFCFCATSIYPLNPDPSAPPKKS
ncbi:MAG: hypothetical protein MSA44_10455 [Bacteroidales bacterium]|nr:hypothetical protein [Bacteroidales bacterium]